MFRLRFDIFDVDPKSGELRRDGERLELQNQPFQILLVLLENTGELVTREELRRRVWPSGLHLNFDESLNRSINKLRKALGDLADEPRFIETLPGRGYRFKAAVQRIQQDRKKAAATNENAHTRSALPPGSPFYIMRQADAEMERALHAQESVILVTGPGQSGKTSLLARALEGHRRGGSLTVTTDLGKLSAVQFSSAAEFTLALAEEIEQQCGAASGPEKLWSERRAPIVNFDRYLKQVLTQTHQHLVWAIDGADQLFTHSFANEFFALVRSWHNEQALRPESPVHRLTVAIAYAREAHLFISDENQSPFNVGTKVTLEDFTPSHIAELNHKYGTPLTAVQVKRLYKLTGGHPLLTHCSLQALSLRELSFEDLIATSTLHEGPFGDHLRRLLRSLNHNKELKRVLKSVLEGGHPVPGQVYDLCASGVLAGNPGSAPRIRCQIYEQFLRRELG